MRRIRIDDARKRYRLKRGGAGVTPADCEIAPEEAMRGLKPEARRGPGAPLRSVVDDAGEGYAVFDQDPLEVLAIDEALARLEQVEPRQAYVVVLRYFAGLSVDESAEALDVSPRTVDDDWRYAKAWLHRELSKGDTKVRWLSNPEDHDREARTGRRCDENCT